MKYIRGVGRYHPSYFASGEVEGAGNEDQPVLPEDGSPQKKGGKPGIPGELPLLPLRDAVAFPDMVMPLVIGRPKSLKLIQDVLLKDRLLLLVAQKDPEVDDPGEDDIRRWGTACVILKMFKFPDDTTRILVQGLSRMQIREIKATEPYMTAGVVERQDILRKSKEVKALFTNIRAQFLELLEMLPNIPDEMKLAVHNISKPGRLADFVAGNSSFSTEERQRVLETLDVHDRLLKVAGYLGRELEVAKLGSKLQSQVQERLGKSQREFYLREQLKAIKAELGEGEEDARSVEIEEFREKITKADMSEEALKEAEKELGRLTRMHPASPEYSVITTYLEWLIGIPWQKETKDILELDAVRKRLDHDHWGLDKVKERILEFVAVRKLKPEGKGPILCFVGPPGTGKTSLGRSIAGALGRKFARMSLGGMRDEAEIRGHRRTYVGAMPGRIIQAISRAGTRNPLIMLDEVDKLGQDFRGDPSSALLEVLDPEQNRTFTDHYLGVEFDLSRVIFIVTANMLDTVPPALRDRLEVIRMAGYAEEEKRQIARRHLIPNQLNEHGLTAKQIRLVDSAVRGIIRQYTREAGVRELERQIAHVMRKTAVRVAAKKSRKVFRVTRKELPELLGPPRLFYETAERLRTPGVSVGLAWTPTGGDILFIEATAMPGKGRLIVTGHVGQVMEESVRTALSLVRSRVRELHLEDVDFSKQDIHVHIPEGAIPKDGPSAGTAMTLALVSLLTGRLVHSDIAVTGEITLRGKVLPVGGIKEKVLAAARAKLKRVVLPEWNKTDFDEIAEESREKITAVYAKTMDDVLGFALSDRVAGKRDRSAAVGKRRSSLRDKASAVGARRNSSRRKNHT